MLQVCCACFRTATPAPSEARNHSTQQVLVPVRHRCIASARQHVPNKPRALGNEAGRFLRLLSAFSAPVTASSRISGTFTSAQRQRSSAQSLGSRSIPCTLATICHRACACHGRSETMTGVFGGSFMLVASPLRLFQNSDACTFRSSRPSNGASAGLRSTPLHR